MTRALFLLLTLAVRPVLPAQEATASWNIRDHISLKGVVVQSHRGAGVLAEEGTLEAFELGWKLETWPEADLRATRDGVIVTFHDNTFARVVKDVSPDLDRFSKRLS